MILSDNETDYPPVVDLDAARQQRATDSRTPLAVEVLDTLEVNETGDEYADESLTEPDRVYTTVDGLIPGDIDPETGDGEQRAIVPDWFKTSAGRRAMAAHWATTAARTTAFHVTRLPLYWARLAGRSPIGLGRICRAVERWAGDHSTDDTRADIAETLRTTHHAQLAQRHLDAEEAHRRSVRARWGVVIAATVLLGFVAWTTLAGLALFPRLAALAGVVSALGVVGRDTSKPLISRQVYRGGRPQRPDAGLVVEALRHCGIGALSSAIKNDPDNAVRFTGPATRSGPGWRIDCDLPPGVTAGEVAEKRDKIAATLRRPLGCVWPEGDPDQHEGRLSLYVSDSPMSAGGPLPWTLTRGGETNVFTGTTIGIDKRGEPIAVTLMFASGIIGALPRMGKSFLLRLLVLTMALDKRTKIYVYNLKGGADFNACRHFAHSYRSGDSDEDLATALADLREIQSEMRRRYKLLERLALERPDICPEGKVTDELASNPALGLHPIGLAADECQVWFADADDKADFEALCTDIVKRGPAVGIMAWLATQRVDAASVPSGISSNAVLRFCLKVMGQVENDMILGTSMYKAGFRATAFSRRDLGIAYLAGEGADPVIVKAAFVDGSDAERIALRARAVREGTGWLTGLAAGDEAVAADEDTTSFLDHLLAAWPGDTKKVSHEIMAGHLAAYRPDMFEDITPDKVSSRGRSHGLDPADNCKGTDGKWTRKGFARDNLLEVLARRYDDDPESAAE